MSREEIRVRLGKVESGKGWRLYWNGIRFILEKGSGKEIEFRTFSRFEEIGEIWA